MFFVEHFADAVGLFLWCERLGLEGVVSKRASSPYCSVSSATGSRSNVRLGVKRTKSDGACLRSDGRRAFRSHVQTDWPHRGPCEAAVGARVQRPAQSGNLPFSGLHRCLLWSCIGRTWQVRRRVQGELCSGSCGYLRCPVRQSTLQLSVPFLLGWPPSGTAPSQCPRRPSPVSEALRPGVRTLSSGPAGAARRWMRPVPIGLSMVPRPSVPGAGIHGAGRSPTPRSSACAAGQGSAAAATALGAWAKSIRAAAAGVVPTNTRPQNPAQAESSFNMGNSNFVTTESGAIDFDAALEDYIKRHRRCGRPATRRRHGGWLPRSRSIQKRPTPSRADRHVLGDPGLWILLLGDHFFLHLSLS